LLWEYCCKSSVELAEVVAEGYVLELILSRKGVGVV
jgi:hypothetical protein